MSGAVDGIAQNGANGGLVDDEGAGLGSQRVVKRDDGEGVEPRPFGGDQPLRRVLSVNAQIWLGSRVQAFLGQTCLS